jgi:lysophospholipase L1-like esterase
MPLASYWRPACVVRAAIFHGALLVVAMAGWASLRRGWAAPAARRSCRAWFLLAPFALLVSIDVFLSIDYAPLAASESTLYMRDPRLHWRFAPGAQGPHCGVTATINAHGFCGPLVPIERSADEYRILFVGDSTTAGCGVTWEETFTAWVPRLLPEFKRRRVTVINAGVDAYTTMQERLMAEECMRFRPDLVVLGFCLNDLTEYCPPRLRSADHWLKHSGIFQYLQYRRFGPSGTLTVERLRDSAPPVLEAIFAPEESEDVAREWAEVLKELTALHGLCAANGANLMLLYVPVSAQITQPERYGDAPQRRLQAFAREFGVPLVDPTRALQTLAAVEPNAGYLEFWHWSASGHRVAAEQLAAALLELGKSFGSRPTSFEGGEREPEGPQSQNPHSGAQDGAAANPRAARSGGPNP